jgi:flagellar protein FliO/FliZ
MDKQMLGMLLNIILVLPFILLLIYISLKYGGSKLQNIQNGRFIKVMERVPLTKDSSIMVVKIGDKAFIMSSGAGKTEILLELEEAQMEHIETINRQPQYENLQECIKEVMSKLKLKKEDKHE